MMAGLLDVLNSDEGRMALGLLSAAGPQAQPMSFGQRLQGAMGQQDSYLAQKKDRALKEQMLQMQMQDMQAQAQQRQAQADALKQKAMEQQRIQSLLGSAFAPVSPGQANAQSGITGPRPEALGVVGQKPAVDFQALIAKGVPPELVKSLAESRNYGKDKVARALDVAQNGMPGTQQLDEFGNKVGQWMPKAVEMKLANLGGSERAYNPFALQDGQSFTRTQSPDSAASNALGWANFGLSKQRMATEQAAGQLIETPDGYVRVGKDNRATAIMAPSGVQPLLGKGAGMTEDQGKATGWLVQAENAYKNMKGAMASTKGAELPGFNDVMAKVPVLSPLANSMRGSDRQKFLQSAESFHEAVLRAATGAGVNKDEAAQKARELTPQLGDSQEVIDQKMAAYPVYIESLKVRAGPGAKKAAGINSQFAPKAGGPKFLGFE